MSVTFENLTLCTGHTNLRLELAATRCVGSPENITRPFARLAAPRGRSATPRRQRLRTSSSVASHPPLDMFGDSPLAWAALRITSGSLKSERGQYSGWAQRARGGETCTPTFRGRLGQILVSAARRVKRLQSSQILSLNVTERRHHLTGTLGCAVCKRFRELGWLIPIPDNRVVRVTLVRMEVH
jgi:hypothetical protein